MTEHKAVRCRDCKFSDIPEWDNTLAMQYGEPPMFCRNLFQAEYRMSGDRLVADTSPLEVCPDDFCAWGEPKEQDGRFGPRTVAKLAEVPQVLEQIEQLRELLQVTGYYCVNGYCEPVDGCPLLVDGLCTLSDRMKKLGVEI